MINKFLNFPFSLETKPVGISWTLFGQKTPISRNCVKRTDALELDINQSTHNHIIKQILLYVKRICDFFQCQSSTFFMNNKTSPANKRIWMRDKS